MNALAWTAVTTIGLFALSAALFCLLWLLERRPRLGAVVRRELIESAAQTLVCCAVGLLYAMLYYLSFSWSGWPDARPPDTAEISTR